MTTPRRPILFVNPPLIGGIAFTRQGRCQEREEVLGTTKPPYSLVVMAALVRQREIPVRLVDLTAEQRSTESLIAELRSAGVAPARFSPPRLTYSSRTNSFPNNAEAPSARDAA